MFRRSERFACGGRSYVQVMNRAGGINGKASRRSQAQRSNWWGRVWQRKVQKRARVIGKPKQPRVVRRWREDGEGKDGNFCFCEAQSGI